MDAIPCFTMVPMAPWYHGTCVQIQHDVKNDLKCNHSGATGKLVGVVSIDDITVCYGSNSTATSAARISTTIIGACTRTSTSGTRIPLVCHIEYGHIAYHGTMVHVYWYHGTRVRTYYTCTYHGTRVPWYKSFLR